MKSSYLSRPSLIAATILLILLAFQYPLSTTFPMGGDATRYIARANDITAQWQIAPLQGLKALLKNSWYPGFITLVVASRAVPLEWPQRFAVLAAISQIAGGLAIGWLLYRVYDWQVAATGISFWAMTPIVAIRDFDDGTIAQLLSYSIIFLLLERFHSAKPLGVIIWLLASFLIHPLTGAIIASTLVITLLATQVIRNQLSSDVKKMMYTLFIALIALFLTAVSVAKLKNFFYVLTALSDIHEPLMHIRKPFFPIAILAPLGLLVLPRLRKSAPHTLIALISLVILTGALSVNNVWGLNILVARFKPYFIIAVVLLAAIALPSLLKIFFSKNLPRAIIASILIGSIGLSTWHYNALTYAAYEDPQQYRRIHPGEAEAISWLHTTVTSPAIIYSTTTNRHSEWIPILSRHSWATVVSGKEILENKTYPDRDKYLVYFLKRENPPEAILNNPTDFLVVFENNQTIIFQIL